MCNVLCGVEREQRHIDLASRKWARMTEEEREAVREKVRGDKV